MFAVFLLLLGSMLIATFPTKVVVCSCLLTGDNSIWDAPLASSFVMLLTFTKQVLAQLHLFRRPDWLRRRPGWASRGDARVC